MNFIIINLKKNFFTSIFVLFTASLLLFSDTNLIAAKNGFTLFLNNVLPSLFPFFIATELLYKTNFTFILSKYFSKLTNFLFGISGEASSAILLGAIGGYPIGTKIACDLKENKMISKVEAERLIAFTNNSGPLFILSSVGLCMYNSKTIGFKLLLVHLLSSFIVGIIFKNWKKNEKDFLRKINQNQTKELIRVNNLGEALSKAIKNTFSSLSLICGFIVIFSVIISILNTSNILNHISLLLNTFNIPPDASKSILIGLLEVTNGVNSLSNFTSLNLNLSLCISSFLIGFGGLSIMLQIYSITSKHNISIRPYFYGKLLQGLFSSILILLI